MSEANWDAFPLPPHLLLLLYMALVTTFSILLLALKEMRQHLFVSMAITLSRDTGMLIPAQPLQLYVDDGSDLLGSL